MADHVSISRKVGELFLRSSVRKGSEPIQTRIQWMPGFVHQWKSDKSIVGYSPPCSNEAKYLFIKRPYQYFEYIS